MDLKELPKNEFVRHPWEKARLNFFTTVLRKKLDGNKPNYNVLDVGSGDAFFANQIERLLPEGSKMTCWDIAYEESFIDKMKGLNSNINYIKERPESRFDLIMMMDVLEHVSDDQSFLKTLIENNIEKDSYVLISVPAWMGLFSAHDKKLGHIRRYSHKECQRVIENSGLEVVASGGLFHSLLFPRSISKIKEKFKEPVFDKMTDLGNWNHGKLFSWIVYSALWVDNCLSYIFSSLRLQIPGLSFWALCRKIK